MTGIEYDDFLDLEYEPAETDLVCAFRIDPAADMTMDEAASRVASESSNGTWAALHVDEDELTDLGAVACEIDGDAVTVAYPDALFEPGSMPQILSCIAGNIMGMKAVDTIRLEDCHWPESIVSAFPGPQFGPSVAHEKLDAGERPVLATVPKPKVGLSTDAHVRVGEEAWRGGVDLLKDDENLTDQDFNPFEDRLADSLAARDRVEDDVGERKDYLVNVTGETNEMLERVDLVAEHGGGFVMVDVITCGWSAVQSVRDRAEEHDLAIHAHRAMHAAFDRLPHHGVSMRVLAQISRLCGVDHIHTGTAGLGKLENEDTPGINEWLTAELYGLEPVLPVASGGLHPGVVDQLLEALGTDIIVQAGGGIHGHPDGTHAGAKALRQSVEASMADVSLEAYADDHEELATALEKWGAETPR
ncbi:type III ribulose-bisphosphate carboxylase [Natrarchaeobaculum sulfurireducens]|uniref:Ribulose bisphosphate carboxylase n=1 Tax=Natrarchaeobaculum sulfurireducens TaxID=2044521 RepID=A0A346PDI8_9EURY|nr:type III ribulose-bisphosphate carboxylase [Natrarchaeobaculum sulfurireducens]AXR77583.1 Ribulose 1,5-bisphosphate carboxylase, large subunit [Natrarchaeobaculum sulfurireducens]